MTHLWTRPLGARPTRVVFSNPSGRLLVGDHRGVLTCLDSQGQRLWRRELAGEVTGVAAWPEGDKVVAGTQDRRLRLLEGEGETVWERTLERAVWSVAVDPEGQLLAVGTGDSVGLMEPGAAPRWLEPLGRAVVAVGLTRGAAKVMACADQNLYAFDAKGGLLWKEWFPEPLWEVSLAEEGRRIAVGCWDAHLYLLDGESQHRWRGETQGQVHGVVQDPQGQMVLTGGHDGYLRLWNREGEVLLEEPVGGPVNSVALSPALTHVACTTQEDQQLRVYRLGGLGLEGIRRPGGNGGGTQVRAATGAQGPAVEGSTPAEAPEGPLPGLGLFDMFTSETAPATEGAQPTVEGEDPRGDALFEPAGATAAHAQGVEAVPSREEVQAFARFSEEVELMSVTAQLRMGNTAYDGGELETALEHYQQATLADPREPRGWFNQAIVLFGQRRYQEALQALAEALRVDPDYLPAQRASGPMMEGYKRAAGS